MESYVGESINSLPIKTIFPRKHLFETFDSEKGKYAETLGIFFNKLPMFNFIWVHDKIPTYTGNIFNI